MKTGKEVKINSHTYTVFECRNYGSGTTVPVKQIILHTKHPLIAVSQDQSPASGGKESFTLVKNKHTK